MNRSLGVGLVTGIFLLATLLVGVPAVDGSPAAPEPAPLSASTAPVDQTDRSSGFLQQSDQTAQFDSVEFRIAVHENGTGVWTFRYERRLANQSEREQFEAFAEEFRTNESHPLYTGFEKQASALVAAGTNVTDRQMNATNFDRSAGVREDRLNEPGVVTMSFHWTNFAQQDGQRVIVGDVFEGGMYVAEDQSLVFRSGGDLAFARAVPDDGRQMSNDTLATSDTVTWVGAQEFTDNKPRVELAPEDTVGQSPDEPVTAPATSESDPWMLLAGVVVLLLGVGSAVAWRRDGAILDRTGPDDDADEAVAATPDSNDDATATEAAVDEEELLTDEDRVTALLEDNGGRMKQVNIVEETGWSKSKVSMLLSDMEEDGAISKLRVGRENIISLDGHEPEAAGSPFENDE